MAVVIIGVLSAVLLPGLGGSLARRKLAGAAGDLHLAMRHLQDVAVLNRRTCRLVVQRATGGEPGRYIAEFQELDLEGDTPFATLKDPALPTTVLSQGLRFGDLQMAPEAQDAPGVPSGGAAIRFFADGSADAAVVALTDGQAVWSVVVTPNTGRARLIRGAVDQVPGGREDLDL